VADVEIHAEQPGELDDTEQKQQKERHEDGELHQRRPGITRLAAAIST
jgi:hypothetical protein